MKAHRGDTKSQGDISETVDRSSSDMDEKLGVLDKTQQDVGTVRQTWANLEFGGTSEGMDSVEESINAAEDVTIEVFDSEDEKLESLQKDSEEYQGELHEHSESDQSDLEEIHDARGRVDTEETLGALEEAIRVAERDGEFLKEQIDRAKAARDESERMQQKYGSQVHGGGCTI